MAPSEKNLRELEGSELFAPDFPRRRQMTHAQWAAMSDDERRDAGSAATIALRRTSNARALADAIKEIGSARQTCAVPVLAKLWSDCALLPVRYAAGHALRSIGTEEARSALEAMIEDADHLSVFLAVRALFDANPSTAFDRLARYFDPQRVGQPGGCKIPQEILGTFGPVWNSARKPEGADWIMGERRWFAADQRWMDLCVRLRSDAHLGRSARAVLRVADVDRVRTALSQARAQEGPRMLRWHGAVSGDLVARYRRGERINMMPVGDGSFYLYLHGAVRKASATKVGDRVEISVTFDENYRGGPMHRMPSEFIQRLSSEPKAQAGWDRLPPSRKKEILRYLAALKSDEARARNIARAIRVLSGSRERFLARDWNAAPNVFKR